MLWQTLEVNGLRRQPKQGDCERLPKKPACKRTAGIQLLSSSALRSAELRGQGLFFLDVF